MIRIAFCQIDIEIIYFFSPDIVILNCAYSGRWESIFERTDRSRDIQLGIVKADFIFHKKIERSKSFTF